MSGGEPIEPGWIRWFGGIMLALGVGCIMAYRKPTKQGIFVTTLCVGSLISAIALLYEAIFKMDDSYNMLNTLIPAIVLTVDYSFMA